MKDKNNQIDTRRFLNHLIDYETVFNETKSVLDAFQKIKDIPSISLLVNFARINLDLYLNDSGNQGQKTQNSIIKSQFRFNSHFVQKVIKSLSDTTKQGGWPIIFYRLSNLLFYEMVLTNQNQFPFREISPQEMEDVIETYLAINSVVNSRINISDTEFETAIKGETIESLLAANFLYQRDYASNSDYTNQVTRCFYLFKYLEGDKKFKSYMPEYYAKIGVDNYIDLIIKLITIFHAILKGNSGSRNAIISTIDNSRESHNTLLAKLSFNQADFNYKSDHSFTQLRNQMFARLPDERFVLLDINFLIDYFYKTQVFAINKFMESKGVGDFLSIKGANFTEKIYLKKVMDNCFPYAKIHSGNTLIKKDGKPLTDLVITKDGNLLLIECKDNLFSSAVKNSGDQDKIFKSLDEKFIETKKRAPKGIMQLVNAIRYLDKHSLEFQEFSSEEIDTIYPVVIYTDNTFGYDGISKNYVEKFNAIIESDVPKLFIVKEVTFINLSFFEIMENYLRESELDIFDLIKLYHEYILTPNNNSTPFEVFATALKKTLITKNLGLPKFYLDTCEEVKLLFAQRSA